MKDQYQHTGAKIRKAIMAKGLFLAIFISCLQLLHAAIDPVTVIVTLSPPYTPFISEYASNGANKLQVTLIVNDGRMLNYPAKLEMYIEKADGSGTLMQTNTYASIAPIMLTGQTTEILTGADLMPYFQPRNINFIGFDQSQYISTGRIPDGMYRIGFRVVDATRHDVALSNVAYSQPGWFLLNDPPYLNLPRDKEEQRIGEPQSLKLEWFPRHVGSMNSAFATSYEVELYPIRVPGMAPNQVALSLQPSYTETANRTSLFITSDKYLLEPGVEYAWRVKAFTDGELTLFQNGGYSEVFSFVYGSLCPDPENVHAKVLGPERAKILWDADPVHTAFEVRFRKKGDTGGIWHTREVFVPSCEISRVLEAGTSYEYQVKAKTPTAGSEYSGLQYFTTPLPANESFECGKQDSVTVTNFEPMVSLGPGDIIYSGEFPIKITQVQGGNGTFSGKGRMRVPFLSNIRVNMVFTGIRVNELGQVYGGKLESVYNPDSKVYIDDVTDYWSVGDQVGNIVTGQEAAQIEVNYTIGGETQVNVAYNNKNNTVTVTGPGGTTTTATIPTKTGGTTIVDAEGKLFAVDTSGHVAEIGQSGNNGPEEYAALVSAYNNLDGENTVEFSNAEKETWAFDQWDETYQGKELIEKEYENLNGYKVPWKLVPAGKYGKIYAEVPKGNIDISKLVFRTPTGTEYKATKKGKGVEITVMGSAHGDGQEIFALYPKGDSTFISLGKVKVASYDMLVRKLFIVPIDQLDANIDGIKTGTSGIFLPLGVEWDIQLSQPFLDSSWDLDGDGLLDAGESGMLSMYTAEMKALNKAYAAKNKIDPEAIYVFVLQGSTGSTGMLLGDMPISSKFGYIFSPKNEKITAKTVAHEVAHGMFQLRHTFNEDYALEKESTDNLMDYTGGTVLFKQQWDAMYDEQALLFAWAQDEEEGAYIDPSYLTMENFTLGELPEDADNAFICFTPAGELITIFDGVTSLNFATRFEDKIADGALTAFSNKKGNYVGIYNFKENKFLGYALVVNKEETGLKEKITDEKGKINFYDENLTAGNNTSASVVYIGYRKNCAIEFHTIMLSGVAERPVGLNKGDGKLSPINDLKFTSSKFLKTLTDNNACRLPRLNLTEFGLRENTKEAIFNPYGKGGLLMLLNIGEGSEYIYQNSDYEAIGYFYRWDPAKDTWVEWTPQTPPEVNAIEVFQAIFEIWKYLIVENPHEFLDALGMAPVIGEIADGINGLWYLIEGETFEAGMSFISIIPIAGDYVGKSIKYIRRIGKIEKLIDLSGETAEGFVKIARKLNAAGIPNLEDNLFELGVMLTKNPGVLNDIERLADEIPDPETLHKVLRKVNSFSDAQQIKFLTDIKQIDGLASNSLANNLEKINEELIESWNVLGESADLRKNIDALETIEYYTKNVNSNVDELTSSFKSATNKEDWFSGKIAEIRLKARSLPGISTGNGVVIEGKWMLGTEGNAGLFPQSVADKLKGKNFKNFDEFRSEFWKTVADDPDLANQFKSQNIERMKEGLAPSVRQSQTLGARGSYEIHHKTPIYDGGSVYDMDNMVIVTPRYHKEILDPAYHFNK